MTNLRIRPNPTTKTHTK
uniref:Uncharacterized protein n=1 Tax=Rhizophora mucronata TaxID=61149 RepID=A0A2P2PHB1_RHIMU